MSRSELLLKEKVAQIDDINFDKIYNINEFANRKIEEFDNSNQNEVNKIESTQKQESNLFEMELQSNDFLDNYVWHYEDEEEVSIVKRKKFQFNKSLLYTFTSIAVLLCILLVYNVFVINSLSSSIGAKKMSAVAQTYSTSNNLEVENNFIVIDNSSKIEIESDYLK